jgi:hypothetical protein
MRFLVGASGARKLCALGATGRRCCAVAQLHRATRFPPALAQLLHAMGVPESQIAAEITAMSPVAIAATSSRRLLGCLNQSAWELSLHFHHEPQATLIERQLWLSENISSVIRYSDPATLARELLKTRRKN